MYRSLWFLIPFSLSSVLALQQHKLADHCRVVPLLPSRRDRPTRGLWSLARPCSFVVSSRWSYNWAAGSSWAKKSSPELSRGRNRVLCNYNSWHAFECFWLWVFYNAELAEHTHAQSNAEFLALRPVPPFYCIMISPASSHMVDQFNTHTIYHTFFSFAPSIDGTRDVCVVCRS